MNKVIYNKIRDTKKKKKSTTNGASSMFGVSTASSKAQFKIYEEYFNQLLDHPSMAKEDGIDIKYYISCNHIHHLTDGLNIMRESKGMASGVSIVFSFKGVDYAMRFYTFKDQNGLKYEITTSNHEKSVYSTEFLTKYVFYCAVLRSDIKGAYLTLGQDSIDWKKEDLEKRAFSDIFLPAKITEDLVLYRDVFKKQGLVQRYLMVGNPGTGKTEATLVLANELKNEGVTVIKTPIDGTLQFKVDLAEILAPSVLIFDDLDIAIGGRSSGGFSQLLGPFLDILDGTNKLPKNVGILATTNAAQLLDMAAQRPGRFNKTLIFNDITKDNIKNIIMKSLYRNFNIKATNKAVELYTTNTILDKLHDAGLTGSHVFNLIEQIKLKYDTLGTKPTLVTILGDIDHDLAEMKKLRDTNFLNRTLDRSDSASSMGFNFNEVDTGRQG